MAFYQIKDIGKVGVVTDLSPTDLPPNAFTDALNARFIGGQITKFGGNKPITYNGPEDSIVAYAIQPMPFDFQYDHPFNILGTKDGLYQLEDTHWENISYWEPIRGGVKTATVSVISHPLMTGIKFTESQVNVKNAASHDFYVTLIPTGVKKQDLIWELADNTLGTIQTDPNNPLHITFHANNNNLVGTTTINAFNQDRSLNDFVFVTVVPNVDSISTNMSTYNVRRTTDPNNYGTASVMLNPTPTPSNPLQVEWLSSDTSVFTIEYPPNSNPNDPATKVRIKPLRVGSADITVQLLNSPSVKAKARVNVTAGVTSVDIIDPDVAGNPSKTSVILRVNPSPSPGVPPKQESTRIKVVMKPDDAPDKGFTMTGGGYSAQITRDPNDPTIYTLTALNPGSDIYQFIADDGGITGMVRVVVNRDNTYSDEPDDGNAGQPVTFDDMPAQAPPVPKMFAVSGNPPFTPKPVDGTLQITQDLKDLYSYPITNNFDLTVAVTGGTPPYIYQWYRDNTLTSITASTVGFSANGTIRANDYQAVITDSSGLQVVSEIAGVYHYDATIPQYIVSVSVDPTSIDFNQGDTQTITSKVRTNDGKNDNLVYFWDIDKNGIVTHDDLDQKDLTIYGLGNGSTSITFQVWPTRQKTFNITPDLGWYHTTIANCAVFTTNSYPPMAKEYGSKMFKLLPGWGDQTEVDADGNWKVTKYDWRCERVRAFNNRLFALNMYEPDTGGVERHYPQRLRWSNFATENKVPTLWDDLADLRDPEDSNSAEGTLKALVNGYAGYIDLADTQGDLMDMLPLKDYLFVYTEFETYVGTPTMNAYQPMTFKKLFNDSGILAPGCAVEVEGGHFVVTQNDIILHNGATKQSIANTIVKEHIIQEISAVNPAATRVYLHQDKKEVWICYVARNHPKNTWYNSKAAVWNYEFQTWTFYELPHLYEIALTDPPTVDKTATWDDYNPIGSTVAHLQPDGRAPVTALTWDDVSNANYKVPWQKNFLNFRKRITVGCSAMKGLYQLDTGAQTWSAYNYQDPDNMTPIEHPLRMWAERYGIDFDNITEEWRQKHVNNFHFQVNGTGKLSIEAGGTQFSNERGHQHNYRDYIAGKTRNLSVRLNHPYLYYGIVDEDPDSDVSISGLVIDFSLGGRR